MTRDEVQKSSAYKMLQFLIAEKVTELQQEISSAKYRMNQALSPTYWDSTNKVDVPYIPTVHIGTTFDEVADLEIDVDLRMFEQVVDIAQRIKILREEIGDLNRHKLYLLQADGDWQDGGRRTEAVFGVKEID